MFSGDGAAIVSSVVRVLIVLSGFSAGSAETFISGRMVGFRSFPFFPPCMMKKMMPAKTRQMLAITAATSIHFFCFLSFSAGCLFSSGIMYTVLSWSSSTGLFSILLYKAASSACFISLALSYRSSGLYSHAFSTALVNPLLAFSGGGSFSPPRRRATAFSRIVGVISLAATSGRRFPFKRR